MELETTKSYHIKVRDDERFNGIDRTKYCKEFFKE